VILSACYMLWLYQRTFLGETPEAVGHHMMDLDRREWAAILPLLALMLWMGLGPQAFLPPISAVNAGILNRATANAEYRVELKRPAPASAGEAADAR
jgi:NADH-quinone oxidoreductase subunit M